MSAEPLSRRPYDARIARWLVTPLASTRVTPNHLTTVRLLTGLAGVALLGIGGYLWSNAGALLFALSNLIDHTDGELARLTGKFSRLGHFYDLACDALIHVLVFVAIGYSLRHGSLGGLALPLGVLAGVAVSLIFFLRMRIEERLGKAGSGLPAFAGFEIEDILYLLPAVTLLDALRPLLVAAAIGAPLFALWVIHDWRSLPKTAPQT